MTPASDRRYRAVEMIRHALVLSNEVGIWIDLATVLQVRLTPHELRMLLAAVAGAANPDDALEVFEQAAARWTCGAPLPVFDDIDEDAMWWAGNASLPELRAWLAATFVRLPAHEQRAFLDAAMRRDAA